MRIRDVLLALATMLLWGLNFAIAKLALAEIPPILLTALRFTLVALILLPFAPKRKQIRPLAELGLILGFLHFPMVFSGLKLLDASTSAIVLQLQVPLGVVMAAVLLDEKLSWRHGIGMAISFCGVALIAGAPRLEANRVGLIFLLTAATAWGYSTVQLKRLGQIHPFTLNGWLGLFISVELLFVSLGIEGSPLPAIAAATWRGWAGLAYISLVSTIIAFGLWSRLVARYSVGQTLPFMLTVPLFAIAGGIVLNGDQMTADIVMGGLLTLAGVALIVFRRPARRLEPAVASPS